MGEINKRDQERDNAICSEYRQLKIGDSTLAIREKYNISQSRLYQILRRNKVKKRIATKLKGVRK